MGRWLLVLFELTSTVNRYFTLVLLSWQGLILFWQNGTDLARFRDNIKIRGGA